jgi:hypothetical protein
VVGARGRDPPEVAAGGQDDVRSGMCHDRNSLIGQTRPATSTAWVEW